jgi:hypothetical protein
MGLAFGSCLFKAGGGFLLEKFLQPIGYGRKMPAAARKYKKIKARKI